MMPLLPPHSLVIRGLGTRLPTPRNLLHAVHFIIMLLAHAPQDALLLTPLYLAHLLPRPVRDAPPALHCHLLAPLHLAALPRRAVGAAPPRLLDVLRTAGVGARLAPGAVGDAQAPLDDAIDTVGDGALAPISFLVVVGRRRG